MKANILHFLKPNLPENRITHAFDASSAVVQMVKHGRSKSSQEYADTAFSTYKLRLHALLKFVHIYKPAMLPTFPRFAR